MSLASTCRRIWRARCRVGLRRHWYGLVIDKARLLSVDLRTMSWMGEIEASHRACMYCGKPAK